MILRSIKYKEFEASNRKWEISDLKLGQINLVVGKNAAGKSRTLNMIKGLANIISEYDKLAFTSGDYLALFEHDGKKIQYKLHFEDQKVLEETYRMESQTLLSRHQGGVGEIFFAEKNESGKFQAPEDQLAIRVRRDNIQHPFFELINDWGKNTLFYDFSSTLGRGSVALIVKGEEKQKLNLKETERVTLFFKKAFEKAGAAFVDNLKLEMEQIGYKILDLGISNHPNIVFQSDQLMLSQSNPLAIHVREEGIPSTLYQNDLSQGMFRALSLLIQINASQILGIPSCIIIDDIGEGLDYERSTELIQLLIRKIKATQIQLIMATNDRFIMNNVPLEYWQIIQRTGSNVSFVNYENSKQKFEDFKYTGLNNFDFFQTDFYEKGFEEE